MAKSDKGVKPNVTVLAVHLYGKRIGTLTRLAGDRSLLVFDDDYVENENRPTLSLSFKGGSGALITDIQPTRVKAPPFFSNLLPEGHLREYLAERGNVNPAREFFLLWLLGKDLPGAVTIAAIDNDDQPPHGHEHDGDGDDEQTQDNALLRFSLAGVQLKFSAIMEAAGGLTIPADGVGGSWITKLPSTRFAGVPENEFAMMELARAVGIDVPEVRLIDLGQITGMPEGIDGLKGQALAVKRFDRTDDGARIHMEDFAQVFGLFPDDKYKKASYRNIAEVLYAETGEAGIIEFVRRLTFNALIGNGDMHLKNWSLLYLDKRTPQLSPAYDLVATVPYIPNDRMALSVVGKKAFADFTIDLLKRFAAKASLPETLVIHTAQDTATATADIWSNHEPKALLSTQVKKAISDNMDMVLKGILETG